MDVHFKLLSQYVATGIEAVAAVIILLAVLQAALSLLVWVFRRDRPAHSAIRDDRLRLGRWLVLSLEFLLAADIIQTAVAPTWDDLGKLAVIVLIRTAVNFFLERDVERAQREGNQSA